MIKIESKRSSNFFLNLLVSVVVTGKQQTNLKKFQKLMENTMIPRGYFKNL